MLTNKEKEIVKRVCESLKDPKVRKEIEDRMGILHKDMARLREAAKIDPAILNQPYAILGVTS